MEIKKRKTISTVEAEHFLKSLGYGVPTRTTLISWIRKYKLGIKIGGGWRIYADQWRIFLKLGDKNEN